MFASDEGGQKNSQEFLSSLGLSLTGPQHPFLGGYIAGVVSLGFPTGCGGRMEMMAGIRAGGVCGAQV